MRKLFYFLVFSTSFFYAQTSGITYQAVIYYPSGQNVPGVNIQNSPMANKPVCLQFALLDNLSQVEYQETIQTTTDGYGMVNLVIGSGNQTGGYASSFNAVVWNTTTKSLKVELDANASCQQFMLLSNNPLSSVPFAYASVTANNVSGVVAIQNGGTGATNAIDAKINLGLGNVDNTSDVNKPVSTATQTALDTKENTANKSTVNTLGTSDVLFPTQNAVKTYVDTQVASATIADATSTIKGKIQLAGDLGGTAAAPTVPALANKENTIVAGTTSQYFRGDKSWQTLDKTAVGLANVDNTSDVNKPVSTATQTALDTKENTANKSTTTTLGTSDVLFPTQNAVKTYVDTQVASATIADATSTIKGKIQLAGDLGGTAAAPTVPALANKENTIVAGTTSQYFRGDKSWQTLDKTAVGLANVDNTSDVNKPVSTATQTALDTKENTANKSTTTTLGTSDVLFPTQNAVKTYVDTQVASATIADATSTVKGKIQLAGDLGGTAAAPTVPGLATKENTITAGTTSQYFRGDKSWQTLDKTAVGLANVDNTSDVNKPVSTATQTALDTKENTANKSTDVSADGTSNVKYPSVKATKDYVDSQIAAGVVDATSTVKGKIQLAGDLTGTAASPAVATGAITTAKLAADAVTSAKITDGTIVVGDLADNAVETAKIKDANVTDAKLDKANIPLSGFGAAASDVALGSNKLTGVADPTSAQDAATKNYVDTAAAAITTLSDGKIYVGNASNEATEVTPTGDITITNAGVTAIGTGKVVTAMLADTAVTTVKITDANVTTAKLANDAVETAKIKDANVTNAKLDKANIPLSGFGAAAADVALGSNKLTGVADPTSAQDAATKNYVDSSIVTNATPDATTTVKGKVQLAGDLTGTAASPAVATGAITTAKLAADAVTSAKITDGTIVVADIADNAIETAKIKNANVTNSKLDKTNIPLSGFGAAAADVALGSNRLTDVADPTAAQDAATKNYVDTKASDITTLADGKIYVGNALNEATEVTLSGDVTMTNAGVTAIGTGKVTSLKILDGTIAVTDIANDAVETPKIKDANVTTAKIANDAITTTKITDANVTYAKIQNVSATDKVLGRISTGAGTIEEISTTGTGNVVRATSPILVTPNLGTPTNLVLTNATGLPLTSGITGILSEANGGTGSATKNFVDLTTDQTIAGIKTFSGTSTVVNQNLTVNAAGTTGQGIILSDDGDIVDNNDGAATFRFTGGVKINNANGSAGTTTKITLANSGNITATGSVSASQLISNVSTGTAPLVVTSTTPVANLNIGGNAATATKLAATKNINGVPFDGSTDITVTAAAGTLTGTTLASNIVSSSLTSVGTITAGTWNGTTIAIANGGTGQTSKTAAFDALSPMTTSGDIIYGGTNGTGTRLAKGVDGQVLTLASGVPTWSNNGGTASVLSKSSTYTIATTDTAKYVVFSGSTASQTITLPSASAVGAGREITIKNIASVSVTINSTAGNLISDSTTTAATSVAIGIEPSNNWIKAISDGANWIILRALF